MPGSVLIRFLWLAILVTTLSNESTAQITPPGLEGSRVAGWVALGFTQAINSKLALATYVGTSTQSSFGDYNLLDKPAISVINQEVSYQFTPYWQAVLAGSIRSQSLYEKEAPYALRNPGIRQELRTYARFFFRHKQGKISWAHSFRPEYRRFYTADWRDWTTPLQVRLRLKSQLSVPLNTAQTTQFVVANEVLSVIDKPTVPLAIESRWSGYRLTEDRLALFVRHLLPKPDLWVDTGLMNQFTWDATNQKIQYTLYLSIDFIFRDPFSRKATE